MMSSNRTDCSRRCSLYTDLDIENNINIHLHSRSTCLPHLMPHPTYWMPNVWLSCNVNSQSLTTQSWSTDISYVTNTIASSSTVRISDANNVFNSDLRLVTWMRQCLLKLKLMLPGMSPENVKHSMKSRSPVAHIAYPTARVQRCQWHRRRHFVFRQVKTKFIWWQSRHRREYGALETDLNNQLATRKCKGSPLGTTLQNHWLRFSNKKLSYRLETGRQQRITL